MLNPYAVSLERAARLWPNRPAIWSEGRTFSYREFAAMAQNLGDWLAQDVGIGVGTRVADLRFNSHRGLVSEFGILRAGAIRVSLNPAASGEELRSLIELTEPSVLLAGERLADRVGVSWLDALGLPVVYDDVLDNVLEGRFPASAPAPASRPPLDVGEPVIAVRFTGGSTGEPKAVVRTASQQQWVAISMLADLYSLAPDDVYMHTQSLSVGAHSFVLPAVMRGATQVVLPRFDAEQVWELCRELGVTVLKCVPTTLRRLVAVAEREGVPQSLRTLLYGAAPAEAELIARALDVLGEKVAMGQTYGQCEAPAVISRLSAADHELARAGQSDLLRSIGRPYSAVDVAILHEDGTPCLPGEVGEVAVRSPIVANWRWTNSRPEPLRPDGAVHKTGDLGHLSGDGTLFLDGRMNDVLVSGGYNVYPVEVERALTAHPAVSEACVVGVHDAEWGDKVCAAVVLKAGVDSEQQVTEILSFAKSRLSTYKVPKVLRVVDQLPVTAANKVSRRGTKEAFFS
jgi:fatty-acyl-CoA synthase